MEAIVRALLAHLQNQGMPVYLADAVPQGEAFPYMTVEAEVPLTARDPGHIRLTIWCAGDHANAARFALHTSLVSNFPTRGMCLPTEAGLAVLIPQGEACCVQSGMTRGATLPLSLRLYPTAKGG